MFRSFTFVVASLAAAALSVGGPAQAAESYDSCAGTIATLPATITTQGVWCMTKDLTTAITSGVAIDIQANNVTLDCNGFKLGGLAAGLATTAAGVRANARMNVVVRNCNVRGFQVGVSMPDGSGHVVEDSRFDGNTVAGIAVMSANSVVRRNLVADTGGASPGGVSAWTYAVYVSDGVDVIENVVATVFTSALGGRAIGVYSVNNDEALIAGNRVRGIPKALADRYNYGILNTTTHPIVIRDNAVFGAGESDGGTVGIYCSGALSRDNAVVRFETAYQSCTSSGDQFEP